MLKSSHSLEEDMTTIGLFHHKWMAKFNKISSLVPSLKSSNLNLCLIYGLNELDLIFSRVPKHKNLSKTPPKAMVLYKEIAWEKFDFFIEKIR